MYIILVNDDGHDAPGHEALVGALPQMASWKAWLPHANNSHCSHRIQTREIIFTETFNKTVCKVYGTPADCVRIGLETARRQGQHVDAVLSGVNFGANLGQDIHSSGTVAAAREAASQGVPGIAFSALYSGKETEWPDAIWETIRKWCYKALMNINLSEMATEPGLYINVNFPDPLKLQRIYGNPEGLSPRRFIQTQLCTCPAAKDLMWEDVHSHDEQHSYQRGYSDLHKPLIKGASHDDVTWCHQYDCITMTSLNAFHSYEREQDKSLPGQKVFRFK